MQTVENIRMFEHHVKLWQGIFNPLSHFSTLRDAERIEGLGWRVLVMSLLAGLLTGISSYITITLNLLPFPEEVRGVIHHPYIKNLIMIICAFVGMIGIPFYIFCSASIFTVFFNDISFGKQFIIQTYTALVFLIHMAVSIPIMYYTQTPFFSLMMPGKSLFKIVNIFIIWQGAIVYNALKQISTKPSKYITSVVIILYSFYFLMNAVLLP